MGSCQPTNRFTDGEGRQRRLIRDAIYVEDADEKRKRRKIKSQEVVKKEIYALFEDYDRNKDGKLQLSELQQLLKDLDNDKTRNLKSYKTAAEELFSILDKNLSNYIEKEEFYEYYKKT